MVDENSRINELNNSVNKTINISKIDSVIDSELTNKINNNTKGFIGNVNKELDINSSIKPVSNIEPSIDTKIISPEIKKQKVASFLKNKLPEKLKSIAGKSLPGIGAVASAYGVIDKINEGDIPGAITQTAAGISSFIPGKGTVASYTLQGVSLARDFYKEIFDEYPGEDKNFEKHAKIIDDTMREYGLPEAIISTISNGISYAKSGETFINDAFRSKENYTPEASKQTIVNNTTENKPMRGKTNKGVSLIEDFKDTQNNSNNELNNLLEMNRNKFEQNSNLDINTNISNQLQENPNITPSIINESQVQPNINTNISNQLQENPNITPSIINESQVQPNINTSVNNMTQVNSNINKQLQSELNIDSTLNNKNQIINTELTPDTPSNFYLKLETPYINKSSPSTIIYPYNNQTKSTQINKTIKRNQNDVKNIQTNNYNEQQTAKNLNNVFVSENSVPITPENQQYQFNMPEPKNVPNSPAIGPIR